MEIEVVNQTRPDYIGAVSSQILNITQAKAQLSSVIERVVSRGEEFLIGRAGKPVAKIIPYQAARKPRRLGTLKGKIKLAKDFDEWPRDLAEALGIVE